MADPRDQEELPGLPADPDSLEQAGVDDVPEERWAQTLVHMVQVTEACLRRSRVQEPEAVARAVVLELANYFGARQWYLPRGDRLRIALRDAEIYRRAKRGNIPQLAQEYGLTDIHVWRIVRDQRALHIQKIQGRLFEEDGA